MSDLLENAEARAGLAKAGVERAWDFTWTKSADILEESYSHALETTL